MVFFTPLYKNVFAFYGSLTCKGTKSASTLHQRWVKIQKCQSIKLENVKILKVVFLQFCLFRTLGFDLRIFCLLRGLGPKGMRKDLNVHEDFVFFRYLFAAKQVKCGLILFRVWQNRIGLLGFIRQLARQLM